MALFRALNFLAAAACALVMIFCLGGALSHRLDALAHFMPFYGLAAASVLTMRLVIGPGTERPTLWLAMGALAVSATIMAPDLLAAAWPERTAPGRQTVKVIQFNVWSHNTAPKLTADWIIAQQPDVVVMEEAIEDGWPVSQSLRAAFPYQAPCPAALECTTLIFSKVPPTASGALESPDSFGRHSTAWARFGEGRNAYSVVGVHNLWPIPGGAQQTHMRSVAAGLPKLDSTSLILAGDFNATPWSFSLARLESLFAVTRRTHAKFSWPVKPYTRFHLDVPIALMPIDHVFAGSSWRTLSVRAGPPMGSDHLPMVVVLTR